MRHCPVLIALCALGSCVRAIGPVPGESQPDAAVRDARPGADGLDADSERDDLGVVTPTLDPTFANGGVFRLLGGDSSAQIKRIAIDSQQRIVVAGHGVPSSGTLSAIVARLLSDGTPDPSFNGGQPLIENEGVATHVFSLALTADDRILVGGELNNPSRYFVVKWLTSGARDTAFGTAGVATFDRGLAVQRVRGILTHENGTLSLVASSEPSGQPSNYLHVRMESDGSLLPNAFGDTVNSASTATIAAVAGAEVVVSRGFEASLGRNVVLAARFVGGQLDPSYGDNGLAARDIVARNQNVWSFTADATGRLYVSFSVATSTSGVTTSGITRLTPSGAIDTTYGNGGFVEIVPSLVSAPMGVALDSRGRLLVIGLALASVDGPGDLFVTRVLANGAQDSSFTPTGATRVVDLGGNEEGVRCGVVDGQGRLLVVGWSGLGGGDGGWVTRWLLPD